MPPPFPRSLCVAALLCTAAIAAPAQAESRGYRIDPVHTRVAFQVSHAGFSQAIGTFSQARGRLDFDREDWSTTRLDVEIPLDTLDIGDADWRRRILDRTFFDAGKYPVARFISTRVERGAGDTATVHGTLTLRGRSQPVALQVTLNALKRHPLTFKRTAGFSARGTLSRKAFGITAWNSVVGDTVSLIIEAEAVLDGDAEAPADPPAAARGNPAEPEPAADPTDPEPDDADDR
jgi:polyisoprenoid-binding protein YceI